jgi:hypothetical protein
VPEELDPTLEILQQGTIQLEGEFVWGSNYTFLVAVEHQGEQRSAVYKPTRGERPLWDFPRASLAHREAAAYLVSEALGWRLVPPTVFRKDGPAGAGSLQLFVEHDPEYHYFNFSTPDRQRLRPTVLFDYLVNNADRKGSHLLIDPADHLWLIDHGICFHEEDKLRTVIWDFCGEPIPAGLRVALQQIASALRPEDDLVARLGKHLHAREVKALAARAAWLAAEDCFPDPPQHRRATPWPPI